MLRRFVVLSAAVAVSAWTGCDKAPPVLRCPATSQSAIFEAAGSCGPPGEIQVVTMPGLCAISVSTVCTTPSTCANVLPVNGEFTGDAQLTNYDATQGNWMLDGTSSDPQADPSSTTCDATAANDAGSITVTCNVNSCVPSGEDTGFQCSQSTCIQHLNPPLPDAGPPMIADSGTTDTGTLDSGEKDSGEKDVRGD
jgi:hypothetical protein